MTACSLTNLGSCLPDAILQYILGVFNTPIDPLLTLLQNLLTNPVDISVFYGFWQLIVYVLSALYIFLFLYAGWMFITAGHDVVQRSKAKMWLQNAILMVLFVSASYFLYDLALQLGASISSGFFSMINPDFFKIVIDNLPNVGLQMIFLIPYVVMLALTVILFTLIHLIVFLGTILFPIGLFLYFLPPTEEYGKFIVHILLAMIFLPAIQCLIIVASSKLLETGTFADCKILVMIATLLLINITTIIVLYLIANKTTKTFAGTSIDRAVMNVGKYFV